MKKTVLTRYDILEVLTKRISRKSAGKLEIKMRVRANGIEFETIEIFTQKEWEVTYARRYYEK